MFEGRQMGRFLYDVYLGIVLKFKQVLVSPTQYI